MQLDQSELDPTPGLDPIKRKIKQQQQQQQQQQPTCTP
eukprot:COSAG02_NODE_11911_length_1631_cov_2.161227_2_plen_37_part_01